MEIFFSTYYHWVDIFYPQNAIRKRRVRRLTCSPERHHELGEAYRLRQPPRVAHYCPSTARKRQPPTFCSHTHTLHGVSRGSHDTRETWRRGAAMRRRAAPSCRAAPRCSAAPCCRTEPCYRAAPCCRAARCVASAPISCGHSAQCGAAVSVSDVLDQPTARAMQAGFGRAGWSLPTRALQHRAASTYRSRSSSPSDRSGDRPGQTSQAGWRLWRAQRLRRAASQAPSREGVCWGEAVRRTPFDSSSTVRLTRRVHEVTLGAAPHRRRHLHRRAKRGVSEILRGEGVGRLQSGTGMQAGAPSSAATRATRPR